ncbi:hypothetical protein FDP41_007545 [Naegleria fowleri]|uniref:Uncharacterized protein n=1 Tax=Naegleria fowleri TaxID=5763 RepID=A0A6A5CGA3_NAEFO|nr:uncharacterized protein FDP41_007545 [Naegleria fowleri]KAF0984368.1 hypothetical protein FDP41_007545 [Naegleria fowleri]
MMISVTPHSSLCENKEVQKEISFNNNRQHSSEEDSLARWFQMLSQSRTESLNHVSEVVTDVLTFDNSSTTYSTREITTNYPLLNFSEYIGLLVSQQEQIHLDELQIHQKILSHRSEFVNNYKNVEKTVIQEISKFYGIHVQQDELFTTYRFLDDEEIGRVQCFNLQEMRDLTSDKRGPTLLHRACQYNYPNLVAFLIRYGVGEGGSSAFSVLDHNMSTPLHYACMSGALEAVTVLLSLHRKCVFDEIDIISMKDRFGNTPLHLAMQNSHFEILQTLINDQPQFINLKKTGNSQSLLHISVENFNVKGLKFILEQNSHRNPIFHTLDQFKCSPTLYAIKCYSKDEKEEQVAQWTRASSSHTVQFSPVSTLNRWIPSGTSSLQENSPNLENENSENLLMNSLIDYQDNPKRWNRLYFLSYLISKEIEW